MRSAEAWSRWVLATAVVLGAAGCASAPTTPARADASPPVAPAAAAPAPTAAPASAAVPAAAQRAFDDAGRALRAGRLEEARRAYLGLVQSQPQLGGPHANLGLMARQAGKGAEAAAELETAVRLSPQQPVYWNELGVTYRQLGQFDKARQAYEHAIALDANYAAPCLNLGILHDLYLGDSARALEYYDRYLALSPSGDAVVAKWVIELKRRKAEPSPASPPNPKDKA